MQFSQNNIKTGLAIGAGIAVFAIIILVLVWSKSLFQNKSNPVDLKEGADDIVNVEESESAAESKIIQEQLNELDSIRSDQGEAQPLTEQEIESQLEQLEDIRQTTNPNPEPLTEDEIEDQLKQLDELRNASK